MTVSSAGRAEGCPDEILIEAPAGGPRTSQPRAPSRVAKRARRLPAGIAFYLQASILVVFLAASAAPTPLYAVYQERWGFSPITTTIVFGVYALAVLAALVTVGSLSDHIGRRPILLITVLVQAGTMLIFATADGVPELLVARVVQGLATGAATGALGAGMLDIDKAKATVANTVSAPTGTAVGALGSALLVQFLPAPTRLVYLVLMGVLLIQAVGVLLLAESAPRRPGALASLRPRFALPASIRGPMLLATPAFVASWSLAGFYSSLGPAVVRSVARSDSLLLGGLPIFVLTSVGGSTVLLLRKIGTRPMTVVGGTGLLAGMSISLVAISLHSVPVFLVGTAVAGVGFGCCFQGAVRGVVALAAPHERAGVVSTVYLVAYLAMGLPVVIAGVLVVYGGGVLATAREYGVMIMILAALVLLGLTRTPREQQLAVQTP